LAASPNKPTVSIKRLNFSGSGYDSIKLKSASSILKHRQEEKEKAEKALRLCGVVWFKHSDRFFPANNVNRIHHFLGISLLS
jgi:hypothetical protein